MTATKFPCLLIFCYIFQFLSGFAQGKDDSARRTMTENQAITLLRSKSQGAHGDSFTAIGTVAPKSAQLAEKSLIEARTKHLDLFGNGILLDLMRSGGYVVLQSDSNSDKATELHLVARNAAGEFRVESTEVAGELSRSDAQALVKKSEEFSSAFSGTVGSRMDSLLRTFSGENISAPGTADERGYLGVPDALRRVSPGIDELVELKSLYAAVQLWPIRHASWISTYAANPYAAVGVAKGNLLRLEKDFFSTRGKGPNFIYDILDLDSVRTREEFQARVQWLKELNSFLDERDSAQMDSPAYKSNVSISTIAYQLGVTKEATGNVYFVMNTSGLIMGWTRTPGGDFLLRGLSVGE